MKPNIQFNTRIIRKTVVLLALLLLTCTTTPSFAQWSSSLWGDSTGSQSNQRFGMSEEIQQDAANPGDGEATVPIDGGLVWLMAAGAAYGAKRIRKQVKDKMKADSSK